MNNTPDKTLVGKKARIFDGWNFQGGIVEIVKDNGGIIPTVDVKYPNGETVTFDKAFVERRII